MASNNETVEQVCEKWLGTGLVYTYESGLIYSELDSDELKEKILRAYKREVNELRECLEQACGDKLGTYTMKGNEVQRWLKALKVGAK